MFGDPRASLPPTASTGFAPPSRCTWEPVCGGDLISEETRAALSACLPSTPCLLGSLMGWGFPRACPQDFFSPLLLCYFFENRAFLSQGGHVASQLCLQSNTNECCFQFSCCPGRLESLLEVPRRKSHRLRKCRPFTAFYEGKNLLKQTLHFRERMGVQGR